MLLFAGEALHVVGVVPLGDRPLLREALEALARVLAPAHVVQGGLGQQVPLHEVGVAEADAAPEHAVLPARRLAHVLVALGGHVRQVDPEAVHVAPVPAVLLDAMGAARATERRAQALAAGGRASLGGAGVGGGLQAVLQQCRQRLATRAVPELLLHRETLLLVDEAPPLFVELLEGRVLDALHAEDPRPRHGPAHLGLDLVELRRSARELLERVLCTVRRPRVLGMVVRAAPLPSGVAADVPAAAVAAGACQPGAELAAAPGIRRLRVVHGDPELPAVPPPGQLGKRGAAHGVPEEHEGADAGAVALGDHLVHDAALQEPADVLGHPVVVVEAERGIQPAQPQVPGALGRHARVAPRRTGAEPAPLLRGQGAGVLRIPEQDVSPELAGELAAGSGGLELHQEDGQHLHAALSLLDHVVPGTGVPGVVLALLSKQQLAEEHEAAAPGVTDRDIGVLGEVLPRAVDLAAAPRGVEAIQRDGEDVFLRGAMPGVDDVRGPRVQLEEIRPGTTEEKLQARVPDLPGPLKLAAATSLLPLLLEEACLGPGDGHEDLMLFGHTRRLVAAPGAAARRKGAGPGREEGTTPGTLCPGAAPGERGDLARGLEPRGLAGTFLRAPLQCTSLLQEPRHCPPGLRRLPTAAGCRFRAALLERLPEEFRAGCPGHRGAGGGPHVLGHQLLGIAPEPPQLPLLLGNAGPGLLRRESQIVRVLARLHGRVEHAVAGGGQSHAADTAAAALPVAFAAIRAVVFALALALARALATVRADTPRLLVLPTHVLHEVPRELHGPVQCVAPRAGNDQPHGPFQLGHTGLASTPADE
mmetsp:Transcript_126297/g.351895  ORF Transcript_126297/g.351895 Transcript_126297/m.351895 type:complete len:817 (-) Transcript_126297:514-2964(-)